MNEIKVDRYYKKVEGLHFGYFLPAGLAIIFLIQCVTPFDPDFDESASLMNIDGSIVKGREVQKVVVSRSTSLDKEILRPVGNCTVYITDNAGNRFDFSSAKKGIYAASIDDAFLETGNSYQLHVITALGDTYESAFDTIFENQPIDSAYFLSEKKYSSSKGRDIDGIQFYIDIKESESAAKFYRWGIIESWKSHAAAPIDSFYVFAEDSMHGLDFYSPERWRLYSCYDAETIKDLYVTNTLNLQKNEKKLMPLHFTDRIDNIKLSVKYCCLVYQYSLGEDAYTYWNQKRVDIMESEGMYTTQPSQVFSNIRNVNNPDEIVLGYFWASAKTEKHFFYEGYYLNMDLCDLTDSIYANKDTSYYNYSGAEGCIDCREAGGTLNEPEYWDND